MTIRIAISVTLLVAVCVLFAADIPKPLKTRFVVGDPVWREVPVRADLQNQYDKCWQTVLDTILDNHFDLATTDKENGYIRTTENEGVVVLGGTWAYKVQISVKFTTVPGDSKANPPTLPTVEKLRIQVAGEIADTSRYGSLKAYFRGYDQVLLQNLFQDLQAKLGSR
jgi:hypothetical protein